MKKSYLAFFAIILMTVSVASYFYLRQGLKNYSLEDKVGQLFILGFNGTEPDYYIRRALSLRNFGGVILMSYNIEDEQQVKELTASLSELSEIEPFIAVDQEGGLVARVRFEPRANVSQSEIEDESEAYQIAKHRGMYLQDLGINLNLSPVVDVATDEASGIYERTFRNNWGVLGDAMVNGYLDAGILASVKHFPSYGNFSGNVEKEIPVKKLTQEEIEVFRDAIKNAPLLMVSPVVVSNIDSKNPAMVSPSVIRFIREELDYDGLLITDDIEMQSIQNLYDPVDFAIKAIEAGVDLVLFTGNPQDAADAYNVLIEHIEDGKISEDRVNESLDRILRTKKENGIMQ